MDTKYSYAREKLSMATETLATGKGDVRSRLLEAFGSCHTLSENHFPKELQKDWKFVKQNLTKFGPLLNYKGEAWRGSVENTMNKIRRVTGQKIAQRLWDMNWELHNNDKYL